MCKAKCRHMAGLVGAGKPSRRRPCTRGMGFQLVRQRRGNWDSKCRNESDKVIQAGNHLEKYRKAWWIRTEGAKGEAGEEAGFGVCFNITDKT